MIRSTLSYHFAWVMAPSLKAVCTERFIILYRQSEAGGAICQAARWAEDKRLDFDWQDARRVAEKIREEAMA